MGNQTNLVNSLVNISNLESKIYKTYKKPKPPKTPKAPKAPKGKREIVFEEMWDSINLNRLAKKNIKEDFTSEEIDADMLSIILRQFKTIEEVQNALVRGLREIAELRAMNQLHELFSDSIYKIFEKLDDIEKITSPAGRKENMEVSEAAIIECKTWMIAKKGELPTGFKLSELVEKVMVARKNGPQKDNDPYLSDRKARNIIKFVKLFPSTKSWQELIKAYRNK